MHAFSITILDLNDVYGQCIYLFAFIYCNCMELCQRFY